MNVLKITDLTTSQIQEVFELALEIENGKDVKLPNMKAYNLFFEPSTRTHYSFISAQDDLDMKVTNFNPESSSLKKGESLYDTVKTFEMINAELFVIRHSQDNYFDELKDINVPIINGGDGSSNHPTQSLLDLYTIYKEYKKYEGLNVCIVGDVKHSRVAHTNIQIMKDLNMNVFISGPEEFNDNSAEYVSYDEAIKTMDVIMLLRVQLERHSGTMKISKDDYFKTYGLTEQRVSQMKDNAIIMHPAPFNVGTEIAREVVECSKSRIFPQMRNGYYVRRALMYKVLKEWN